MNTIFLADDNRNIRELLTEELQHEGYEVVTARNGEQVIELVKQKRPHLVVLDVRMPGLGGLEAVERIKTFAPEVPVIFFAIDCEHYRRDPRGCLAEAWIEKREEFTELKQVVARLLSSGQHKSVPANEAQ